MKNITKAILAFILLLSLAVSFWMGGYLKEQEYLDGRKQRCARLILFAIDKTENHDLSDSDVMEALISNLYAAHEFCDDPVIAAQLNDLWNTLIYRSDIFLDKQQDLTAQLRDILTSIHKKSNT